MSEAIGSRGAPKQRRRAISALLGGALVAGFGFSILKMAIYRVGLDGDDVGRDSWNGSLTATIIDGVVLSFAYSIALLLTLPIWLFLKRTVLRAWWTAGLFGVGVTAFAWAGLFVASHTPLATAQSFGTLIAAMMLANGAAGVVIWRLAADR